MTYDGNSSAVIADVTSNTVMTFIDSETLGKVTVLLEGNCERVMLNLPYLLETSAARAIERILGSDNDV